MSFSDYVGFNNIIPKNIDSNTNTISFAEQKAFWNFGLTIADTITIGNSGDWDPVIGAAGVGDNNLIFHMWYKKTEATHQRLLEFKNSSGAVVIYVDNKADGTFELFADRATTDGKWTTSEGLDTNKWYCIAFRFAPNGATSDNPILSYRALGESKVDTTINRTSTPNGDFTGMANSLYLSLIGDSHTSPDYPLIGQISQFAVLRTAEGPSTVLDSTFPIGLNGSIIDNGYLPSVGYLYYISAVQSAYGHFIPELSNFTASLTDPAEYVAFTNSYFLFDNAKFAGPTSYLNSLISNLNGPYGHPSFKQTRVSQNPLTRLHVANNVYSIVEQPSEQVNIGLSSDDINKVDFVSSRYGDLINYDEMCLESKNKPLLYVFGIGVDNPRIENKASLSEPNIERIIVRDSFGNEIDYFGNRDLNNRLNLKSLVDDDYERITKFYLDGGLDADDSPVSTFELLKYSERVWPTNIYAYKSYTRQRPNYTNNFWRELRSDRTKASGSNGFENTVNESMWTMDAASNFETLTTVEVGYDLRDDAGILQNNYSLYALTNISTALASTIQARLRPAPYYNRRHALKTNVSVVAPSGIDIPETGSVSILNNFQGTALWEAPAQAGKGPFDASYDKFIADIRPKYKDYSIIPEYTVSKHVKDFYYSGSAVDLNNVFEISGAKANTTDSSDTDFYKVYSTSDFLGHFAKIKKDHEGFTDPSMIKLSCRAVKKFIAHDSFYPQQRTVDIAKQFWSSFSPYISSSVTDGGPRGGANVIEITKQNLLNPLFAPGVLYNSIKAGVACDYPLITNEPLQSNPRGSAANEDYAIMNDNFDLRVPFEALINPKSYLANVDLISNEPHPSGNLSASCFWNGGGEPFYNAMMSNFCAETADFFLANGNFTYLQSKPQSDPNFGQLEAGLTYAMRIRMYRSMETFNLSYSSASVGAAHMVPQDLIFSENLNRETITMYSRPSAFGPACGAGSLIYNPTKGSKDGYNFPFTPPYYHGQSWCDITFTPSSSKKHTLSEILNAADFNYIRVEETAWTEKYLEAPLHLGPQASGNVNNNAMQISASLIINGVANYKQDILFSPQRQTDISRYSTSGEGTPRSAWTIQARYETPILNFKDVSVTTSARSPATPRGMWHQYGRLPEGDEGIYMDVVDIPRSWLKGNLQITDAAAKKYESLADALGFSQNPVRLGNTANRKTISEAIVAVPFIDVDGDKKFFEIQRETINSFIKTNLDVQQKPASPSVYDMLKKMRRYNFPPNLDFLLNSDITPFAMYIFEFFHTLDEQDLADIWQGLPPKIGLQHEEVFASISHPLLAKELLGGGFYNNNTRTGDTTPDKIRWMVFKVKRKAKKNYFRKIFSKNSSGPPTDIPDNQNFNWPYDFFSLVELAKINAEFTFSDIVLNGSSVSNSPKGREFFEKSTRTEALLSSTNDPIGVQIASEPREGTGFRRNRPGVTNFDDSPDEPTDIPADFPGFATDFFDFEGDENPADSNNPPELDSKTAPTINAEDPELKP
jgi:hypothetical protein